MGANGYQIGGTHYKDAGVQPWDVVDTWPLDQRIGAYRHGALKYLMRMGSKDKEVQELKKAGHYIEKLIEVLETSINTKTKLDDAYDAQYKLDRIKDYAQ